MNALTLDMGFKLIPLPEEQWNASLTKAQQATWTLIQRLAQTVADDICERELFKTLGLQSPLPLRSRIKHLVEKGALLVEEQTDSEER
jgi:hypothetical protein